MAVPLVSLWGRTSGAWSMLRMRSPRDTQRALFFWTGEGSRRPHQFIQKNKRGGYILQIGPLPSLALRNLKFEERAWRKVEMTLEQKIKHDQVLGCRRHLPPVISRRARRNPMPKRSISYFRRCTIEAGRSSSFGDKPLDGGGASSSNEGCKEIPLS
jgi:hypothetical protein